MSVLFGILLVLVLLLWLLSCLGEYISDVTTGKRGKKRQARRLKQSKKVVSNARKEKDDAM